MFDPGDVAGSYDAMAAEYAVLFAGELERNPSDTELLEMFAASLRSKGPVCDLGCGPGHVAAWLSERGVDAVGIDLSEEMVEVARRRHPGVAFEQGDLRQLGADGRRWAGAVAYYSLIHLRRDELVGTLRGVHAALEPGGVLASIVHVGEGEIHVDEWRGHKVRLSATLFGVEEFGDSLIRAGFSLREVRVRSPYEWELERDKLQVLARQSLKLRR